MIEKLRSMESKLLEIDRELALPGAAADQAAYRRLLKERKTVEPLVLKFREYEKAEMAYQGAQELLNAKEPELRALAQEESALARADMARLESELKILLLPHDSDDDKSVIMEIRAGVGGEEAALFAAQLFRMYSMYAETHGFQVEVLSHNENEIGGFKEISFLVEGVGVYSRLKFESGAHRVQRVPETESSGRIHTSAVTVAVLPEAEDIEIDLDPADLQIDAFRSSGAGGQKVNKTSSAIRVTHLPTGTVVECQDERSQLQNRDKALRVLGSRLYEIKKKEQTDKISADRKGQVGTGDRSERIRTYNFPQGRVTDHRIGLTLYKLEAFLNGEMDEMLNALIANDQAEKLKAKETCPATKPKS